MAHGWLLGATAGQPWQPCSSRHQILGFWQRNLWIMCPRLGSWLDL
ncbi:hypothetical protein [Herpetosiphon giganteus]